MTNNDIGSPPVGSADVADSADADLVLRTRSGDAAAFGELWRRHYRSGVTVARSVSSSLDPDDLVQEAYTRIYQSIVRGGGPTGSFRAYLFTSIRNTAAGWGRARRETAIDALDSVEDPSTSDQATTAALDHSLTNRAFRSLPTRWQEVLWYSEIEGMKPAEIAPLLGMKATAVAQLTFRAREGLREAWIQAHLRSVVDGSDCQWTIEHLGAYSRSNIGQRDRVKVESHLASCARCAIVASEAKEVSGRLALVLLPLTLGAVGTAGYLASLQGGGTALVTLAAMPSAVMQGAVTVLPAVPGVATAFGVAGTAGAGSATGVAAGAGSAAAGIGSAGAGSAVAGAASTAAAAGSVAAGAGSAGVAAAAAGSAGVAAAVATAAAGGGILSGIGAMASLAAASLIVAGTVVAAVVVLPSFAPTSKLVEETGTAIVQEAAAPVAPQSEGSAADAPPMTGGEAPPVADAVVDAQTTDGAADVGGDDGAVAADAGSADAGGDDEAVVADVGSSAAQGAAAGPKAPASTDHPAQPEHPATPSPSPPGQQKPDPQPPASAARDLPGGSPAFAGSRSYLLEETDQVNIEVVVSGAPGATAQLRIRGEVRATGVIGGDGTTTLYLQPTAQEVRTNARVELRYVNDQFAGPPTGAFISDLL